MVGPRQAKMRTNKPTKTNQNKTKDNKYITDKSIFIVVYPPPCYLYTRGGFHKQENIKFLQTIARSGTGVTRYQRRKGLVDVKCFL